MLENKKIVLFDIDYTVFNTHAFRANLYEFLAKKLGYKNEEDFFILAKQIEGETRKKEGYFKPLTFLNILKQKATTELSLQELEDIFFDESLYIKSLYEDARSVFQELVMKRGIQINIFSTGEKKFQMKKITALKEMLLIDNLHIFVDKLKKLKEVLNQYNDYHIYMVDDFPTVLDEAKKFNKNITTIWVNRNKKPGDKELIETFKIDHTVSNLEEIIPFISNENLPN